MSVDNVLLWHRFIRFGADITNARVVATLKAG